MPIEIKNQILYRTKEACQILGISRSTLLRWFAKGMIEDTSYRDIRGWRLFTRSDISRIEELASRIE
jgi:excisionase family DNA binding protein